MSSKLIDAVCLVVGMTLIMGVLTSEDLRDDVVLSLRNVLRLDKTMLPKLSRVGFVVLGSGLLGYGVVQIMFHNW